MEQKKNITVKKQHGSNQKSDNVQETTVYLNFVQRQMYRRLMYGLKEYSPEQISTMSPYTINQIVTDYHKATRILHILKAKKLYKRETDIVRAIFPHAKIGEKEFDWLIELPKTATLKKLGITTEDVINEFIKKNLLPKNFYSITADNIEL